MNIGLIDVDSHNFPNLALMKISAYHKDRGDSVEWWNGLKHYDIVYKSRVFDDTYSQDMDYVINADKIFKGGTGYGLDNYLPDAWDNYEFDTYEKLKRFRPMFKADGRRLRVYVLTNFATTHEQDIERITKLRELDYDPYVMVYNKPKAPKVTRQLQRWCNNKFVFWKVDKFDDYDQTKAGKEKER